MERTKRFINVLLITFVLSLMFISTIYADTVNEDVKEARNGVLQVNVEYKNKDGYSAVLGGGTGFLINDEMLITAYHVAFMAEDPDVYDEAVEYFGDFDPDKVTIKVVVKDDIFRTATVVQSSEKYDFAILELDKSISDREILPLYVDGELSETEQVFALGFPDSVSMFQNENSYTSSDVTISDGRVTKTTETDGVKYVQHSASLSAGYSGGPLVNENGEVVAVNRGTVSENNYSVAIEEIIYYLEADKIDYEKGKISGSSDKDDEDDKTVVKPGTEVNEEVTTAKKPEATTASKKDRDEDDAEEGLDTNLVIAIVAIVVVVLVIIIILIITLGKGKKQDTRQVYQPPFPSAQNGGGMNNGGFNGGAPYSAGMPTPPQPPMPPQNYSSEGAGATTVLSEGGDATTVLGVSAVSPVAITRVKTGERISITKPEFMIGKERRRVDYCISDNNSVSRVHAKVMNRGGQLFLMDMGATNGTFVNGTKLSTNQEVRLSSGDKFKLADEEFQV